ncbi:VOC family protein [Francisella noatunensis]|uniref:VOC family protein n=1 Tax=Francisella noatunensis TaxID=657445 RepID=A0A9Q2KU66_9GAMM|nr:VOC family protein [Francisella noatunensis]MBK2028426.1 VOC family protein [Francisella noatunensis]MBK2034096.1 VOC family protein [Francisella noatunensis]MBK2048882.1 VOC family protein [Francisella noatunensis]MBK2050793.1 VOC family protein [Francisella noatunensis]MBK2052293.1 VOC family protein [Francisella noatunensis]
MLNINGLSHINITVDNIEKGIEYYKNLFNAKPIQIFHRFKNDNFYKSAGFMENYKDALASIAFLKIENIPLTLELMEYHNPKGDDNKNIKKKTNDIGNVGHISLKTSNIDKDFDYIAKSGLVSMINSHKDYKPYTLGKINPDQFKFFDKELESSKSEKHKVCKYVSSIKYFYFIDKYGVQWELEQGNDI